jgi:CRISPR-associated protein Cmr3
VTHLFLKPLDVLLLRGNQLFGDPGSYGRALVPPWPSVFAGALRSRMLADDAAALASFTQGQIPAGALGAVLGTPAAPGSFGILAAHLARCADVINEANPQPLFTLPADLVVAKNDDPNAKPKPSMMKPAFGTANPLNALKTSYPLTALPVLQQDAQSKLESGYFLTLAGWKSYLNGDTPDSDQLVHSRVLWKSDLRVGVALNESSGAAQDGALFSTEAIAMNQGVGFWLTVGGCEGITLPTGFLRLGGDGRAANSEIQKGAAPLPSADLDKIITSERFKLILTTPGIFPDGWKLPGLGEDYIWQFHGIKARLISAAVPRAEVVSGWDLVKCQPKPAQRVAPTGSVYWLELLEGSAADLRNISNRGLWDLPGQTTDKARRTEGFNRCAIANWIVTP